MCWTHFIKSTSMNQFKSHVNSPKQKHFQHFLISPNIFFQKKLRGCKRIALESLGRSLACPTNFYTSTDWFLRCNFPLFPFLSDNNNKVHEKKTSSKARKLKNQKATSTSFLSKMCELFAFIIKENYCLMKNPLNRWEQ